MCARGAQSMLDPVDIYSIANIVANVSSWNMTAKPKHPQKCNRISNFSLMIILPRGRELQISYYIVSAQSFWTLCSINYLKLKTKNS